MQAFIKSIKLKKTKNRQSYLSASLCDEQGHYIGTFGNSKISDPVNFRTFLFGIMGACDCFDLLKLSANSPKEKEIEYYYLPNDSKIIINENNLALAKHTNGGYFCSKLDPRLERLCELKKVPREKGHITHIKSASGVFLIGINSRCGFTNFVTNQIYYGFSYLWGKNENRKQEDIRLASAWFQSFIESVLKLYNTNDILKLNGPSIEKLPSLQAILDNNGSIIALTNTDKTFTLYLQENEYVVTNDPNLDLSEIINKEKTKSLIKRIITWRP